MDELIKTWRSKAQIKQLSLLKAMRRYKALGFAYHMAPIINTLITEKLSQRAIAERLTLASLQTASEWVGNNHISRKKSSKVWTQTQVSRLLKDINTVKEKMMWYYIKAHQYKQTKFDSAKDPLAHRYTGKFYKLVKHKRKFAFTYYQEMMNNFRVEQMHKAGEFEVISIQLIPQEYVKFSKRKSYHKAKKAAILKPLKATPLETLQNLAIQSRYLTIPKQMI